MSSEDFIIRMIRQLVAVLARIIGFKEAGQYQQARQSIDQALELLFGMTSETVRLLDDASLLSLLEKNEALDGEHLGWIADLFKEEGDIYRLQDQAALSLESYIRSLHYYLMIRNIAGTSPSDQVSQKIAGLLQKVGIDRLDDITLWDLYGHFDQVKEYTRAEGMLESLAARSDSRAAALDELKAFYQRLLDLSPQELNAAGLSREQIQRKLNDLG